MFGASSNTGGGLFGASNTSNSTSGGGLFGNKPAATTNTGFGFGQSNTTGQTNSTGGLFGQSQNNNTNATSGGLFGSNQQKPAGGGLFGSGQTTNSATNGDLGPRIVDQHLENQQELRQLVVGCLVVINNWAPILEDYLVVINNH